MVRKQSRCRLCRVVFTSGVLKNLIVFQIIHTSLECSTTPSSPLDPSSHRLLILACCWQLPGSYRATCRRDAACRHGKHGSITYFSNSLHAQLYQSDWPFCLWHRDTYSDRSGSSSPDSEISELKLPSISNEWPWGKKETEREMLPFVMQLPETLPLSGVAELRTSWWHLWTTALMRVAADKLQWMKCLEHLST